MNRRYLLVSHIPFMRVKDEVIVDQLWANDLAELTEQVGPIRLAAPEEDPKKASSTWGPKAITMPAHIPVTFVSLPPMHHSWEFWTRWRICSILRAEVKKADIVHSSNVFNPYLSLLYAHFLAARLNKKTIFVIAEDYHDSIIWEWVRLSKNRLQAFIRSQVVKHMDRLMQKAVNVASLSFLFTPAAVQRFRLYAKNAFAVRDTTHSIHDIITAEAFTAKCQEILSNTPLKLVAACRHKPLKGVEFIIRAVAELRRRDIYVEADLFGHGPLTTELIQLAKYLKVADRVRFPGALSANKEVFDALAKRHLSLMPHRTNEFARALYDSLAGGTPVLAFRTAASEGSIREEVDGLLAPLDNAIALAVAIERLHHDRQRLVAMSQNSRQRAFLETRTIWHQFRANLVQELFHEELS